MSLSRRSIVAGLPLLAIGLSACGNGQQDPDSNSTASDGGSGSGEGQQNFSHTAAGYDDLTITLDKPAEVVVADIYSASALLPYGFKADGVWGYGDDDASNALNLDEENVLGLEADLSLEKLAALKPDLLIGVGNKEGDGWTWWDEKVTEQVSNIAPYLPVKMRQLPSDIIAEYAAIADALGLDTEAPEVTADKERYEEALQSLKQVTEEKGESITVLALGASKDEVWTSQHLGVVRLLKEHGVSFAGPDHPEDEPWASTSWENITDYQADVVLEMDTTADITSEHPTFQKLPAVEAGQVMDWNDKRVYTYKGYADWLERFVDLLESAEDIVA